MSSQVPQAQAICVLILETILGLVVLGGCLSVFDLWFVSTDILQGRLIASAFLVAGKAHVNPWKSLEAEMNGR